MRCNRALGCHLHWLKQIRHTHRHTLAHAHMPMHTYMCIHTQIDVECEDAPGMLAAMSKAIGAAGAMILYIDRCVCVHVCAYMHV